MVRSLFAGIAILALTSAVQAAPILTFTSTAVGGGLTAYDFTFKAQDALNSSAFAAITFSSATPINQLTAFGSNVDSKANADLFGGIPAPGYTALADSWFYSPWIDNLLGTGVTRSSTTFGISGGTGTGSQVTDLLLAHIVSASPVSYAGELSRGGQNFTVSGSTAVAVPEPASLVAVGLGALALIARRRKQA